MSRPLSTTEILQAILQPGMHGWPPINLTSGLEIEAEPKWFPHNDDGDGEAQAIVMVQARRYAVSLEPLP